MSDVTLLFETHVVVESVADGALGTSSAETLETVDVDVVADSAGLDADRVETIRLKAAG